MGKLDWTRRLCVLVTCLLVTFFLSGCSFGPNQPRYALIAPAKEAFKTGKLVVVPAKVMQEYVSSGDKAMDAYLTSHPEVWQKPIAEYLQETLHKKMINVKIVQVNCENFKNLLQKVLAKYGRKGFINPTTDKFDEKFYKQVMLDLANQYHATLVVPYLILKSAHFTNKRLFDLLGTAKADWDGVSRTVDTGGSNFEHFILQEQVEGNIPVYSLHVEIYTPQRQIYWGNGGFDLKCKLKAGFGNDRFENIKLDSLFQNNEKHIQEAVEQAFGLFVNKL